MSASGLTERQLTDIHAAVEAYYTTKISRHGATPRGVDWSCVATQELRFLQLLEICDFTAPFSLNDVGCGYGALLAYISKRHAAANINYMGIDLSSTMIDHARRLWRRREGIAFANTWASPRIADYSIASGVFNIKLDHPINLWERFINASLANIAATSRRGFAINFLAPAALGQVIEPVLYRTAPEPWIAFCTRSLNGEVEIRADYGMREFTLLVRR
jgi:SAM-dependent methyltransferase